MAEDTNIRIITSLGELAYRSAEDLGISFNRIVDDFQEIDNRFQDFSYDFELPYMKQNSLVFGSPEALGSKGYFPLNQSLPCEVYLNNQLLLDGLINLESITKTGYRCKFYSKFKELIDKLNEPNADGSDKTLRDLQFPVIENWDYEDSVIAHQATYGATGNSDNTFYQFPFCKYSTFYTEANLYGAGDSGNTSTIMQEAITKAPTGRYMRADDTWQNYYIFINSNLVNNTSYTGLSTTGHSYYQRVYIHQVPPCVYMVSIVKQIVKDAGWQLGGQFWNDKNIKKIVLTYAGDEDIFDQATGRVSGSTALTLQIAKFLPDMNQADFLKNICNIFNLYIKVDVANKIVDFETYDVLFGDTFDAYDITNKVDKNTVEFRYEQNNDPSIIFEPANNQNIMGDNYVMSGNTNNAYEQPWLKVSKKNFNSFFNRLGTTDEINIDFSEPTICRQFIYNDVANPMAFKNAKFHTIYIPLLSKQTPTDNDNRKFNAATGDTYLYNTENTIKFAGKPALMYYYGRPVTTFENKTGMGSLANYMYYNMYTATGTTLNRVYIPVVSPFQLYNYRDPIEAWLSGVTLNNVEDRRTTAATYIQTLYQLMGQSTNLPSQYTTDFSLVFDDNGYYHDTLWSKFHKNKWDRYKYSEMLEADMRMNAYDWQEMQIERPIRYNKELYSIVAIEGYDPIRKSARIKLIKRR